MSDCKCTMREAMVGDGCEICNPEMAKEVLRDRIAELEAEVALTTAHRDELLEENQRLRDPDWVTYVTLTRKWLEKYPPDIFTGVSGDPGPLFVVAVRNALKELEDRV